MLQQRVTERSEHAVVVTVQFRPPRQIDGLCNTNRPPRRLGKNHPGITPFGYCLVPLWSATLLRETGVTLRHAVSTLGRMSNVFEASFRAVLVLKRTKTSE